MRKRVKAAQSVAIMQLFVGLGAGAIMVWLVQRLAPAQRTHIKSSDAMTNSLFASSTEWFQVLITNLPIVMLGIVTMGGIAFAVYQTNIR